MLKREDERRTLKDNGYRWTKPNGVWQLLDPNGKPCSKEEALTDIKTGNVPVYVPTINHIDRASSIRWAQSLVCLPHIMDRVIVLDTETSGLGEDAVVIEVSAVSFDGGVVIDTLVNPDGVAIDPEAAKTHGITEEMLASAPLFTEIWSTVKILLDQYELIVYNSNFDLRLLRQTAARYHLPFPTPVVAHDLMKQYGAFYGEVVPGQNSNGIIQFQYQKLERACEHLNINPGGHRALADAEAARQVLLAMASAEIR